MSQRVLASAIVAVALLPVCAAAQARHPQLTVEQIVERHIVARGGEAAMRAISTLAFDRGAYSEQGTSHGANAVMLLKRPYYKLVGHPERAPDYLEGYDGAAWEWFKDSGLTIRTTGAASEAARHYADVDGPFLDYREKGSTVTLIGQSSVGGRGTYAVRLTMMNGYVTDFFIDTATFLISASRHRAKIHDFGEKVTSETL